MSRLLDATAIPEFRSGRLFLLGFMGAGKSYWAERMAKKHKLPWFDLDSVIEAASGYSIADLFQSIGETAFRAIEADALRRLAAPLPQGIIACGGGTPCFHGNMDWMNQAGTTIYLKTAVPTLVKRLEHGREIRPLLRGMSDDELVTFLDHKLAEREPVYQQARLVWRSEFITDEDFDKLLDGLLNP